MPSEFVLRYPLDIRFPGYIVRLVEDLLELLQGLVRGEVDHAPAAGGEDIGEPLQQGDIVFAKGIGPTLVDGQGADVP